MIIFSLYILPKGKLYGATGFGREKEERKWLKRLSFYKHNEEAKLILQCSSENSWSSKHSDI